MRLGSKNFERQILRTTPKEIKLCLKKCFATLITKENQFKIFPMIELQAEQFLSYNSTPSYNEREHIQKMSTLRMIDQILDYRRIGWILYIYQEKNQIREKLRLTEEGKGGGGGVWINGKGIKFLRDAASTNIKLLSLIDLLQILIGELGRTTGILLACGFAGFSSYYL